MNNYFVYKYSCPTRDKIRKAKSFYSKKIICISHNIVFDSIKQAARYLNTSPSNVRSNLNGKIKKVKNHIFVWG